MEILFKALEILAPVLVGIVVQFLKNIFNANGVAALALVFVLGGSAALLGVGPSPNDTYIDQVVNAGYITGMATFIYSLVKQLKGK